MRKARKKVKTYVLTLTPVHHKKAGEVEKVEVEGVDVITIESGCESDIQFTAIVAADGTTVFQVASYRVLEIRVKRMSKPAPVLTLQPN